MPLRRGISLFLLAFVACGGEAEPARRLDATPMLGVLADPSGPAIADLRAGRLAGARATLEGRLALDPDGLSALNDLAVSYAVEERVGAARQLLEEVLVRGGPREQQVALVNLAEIHALDGYLGAAEAYLLAARAIDPARAEPSYALALLADARGDAALSATALREALGADPAGDARRALAFVHPEERLHLEALLAEASRDPATAEARWRELARSRFRLLAQAALRRLE
jgi:Tfp pilus assembly protein PilF